jgi:hypothetical protein
MQFALVPQHVYCVQGQPGPKAEPVVVGLVGFRICRLSRCGEKARLMFTCLMARHRLVMSRASVSASVYEGIQPAVHAAGQNYSRRNGRELKPRLPLSETKLAGWGTGADAE